MPLKSPTDMENNFLLTEDMLWDFADDLLAPEDRVKVDAYLLQHPEQQARIDAILAEKRVFAALPTEQPNTGFADRVMAAWVSEQARNQSVALNKGKDWIIYSIAAVMGLFVLMPIVLMVISAPAVPTDIIPAQYLPQTQDIPWGKLFTNPIARFALPMALLFFSFRFLDQYLQQKKMLGQLQS